MGLQWCTNEVEQGPRPNARFFFFSFTLQCRYLSDNMITTKTGKYKFRSFLSCYRYLSIIVLTTDREDNPGQQAATQFSFHVVLWSTILIPTSHHFCWVVLSSLFSEKDWVVLSYWVLPQFNQFPNIRASLIIQLTSDGKDHCSLLFSLLI